MAINRKQKIKALLKGIETGDPESVKVVNETEYIQHNPQTHEGSEGLADLFKRLSKTNPKINIVRIFADFPWTFRVALIATLCCFVCAKMRKLQ